MVQPRSRMQQTFLRLLVRKVRAQLLRIERMLRVFELLSVVESVTEKEFIGRRIVFPFERQQFRQNRLLLFLVASSTCVINAWMAWGEPLIRSALA